MPQTHLYSCKVVIQILFLFSPLRLSGTELYDCKTGPGPILVQKKFNSNQPSVSSLPKPQYTVRVMILLPWHSDYGDANSEKAHVLSNRVTTELAEVLERRPKSKYEFSATELSQNGTYIEARLQMTCTLPLNTSVAWYRDQIYFLIKEAASEEILSFGIDSSKLLITGDDFCSSRIPLDTGAGLMWWYSQLPGQTSNAPCPENPDHIATMKCRSHPVTWESPNTTMCQAPSKYTKGLEVLSQSPITNATLTNVTRDLVNLTQDIGDFKDREVSLVANITQNCLTAPNVPVLQEEAAQIIASVNKILSVDFDTLVNAELKTKATTRLVQSVERVGSKVEGTAEGVKIVEPLLGVLITKPPTDTGLLFETSGDVGDDLDDARMQVHPSGFNLPDPSGKVAAVHLPSSVLERGKNTTNIHFALYNNPDFFVAAEKVKHSTPGNISGDNSSQFVLNSKVVSAKVGKLDLMNLTDPVIVTLRHVNKSSSKHVCVYWDYKHGGWSADGCYVTSSRDDTTTCQCNHLTNFALLLDIYAEVASLPPVHMSVLSFVSYIGCGVSATGLILTLLTYLMSKGMLRDNPSKILVNLCVALLGIVVAFVFSTQLFVRDNAIACKFLAALTHYFLLAAMAWMSLDAFYLYIAIVRVFHTYYSKFLTKCCIIGWGIPLVVVITTVGISQDNYGEQGEICWLPRLPFFVAILGPVALTLVLNSLAFALVIHQLRQKNDQQLEKSKRPNILSRLRGTVGIMVLLGLTWVFAFFAVGPGGIVFTYLFAIFNSLQGLFVFIFHCLLKQDAQKAWMNCLSCHGPGSAMSSQGRQNQKRTTLNKPKMKNVTEMNTLSKDASAESPSLAAAEQEESFLGELSEVLERRCEEKSMKSPPQI